jgi:predicted transcriptional regulator
MTTTTTVRAMGALQIPQRRRAIGLTQRQLAVAAECSLSALANIEAGCVPRSSAVFARIIAVLDQREAPAAASAP